MGMLSDMTPEDREILVSLPYRVGVWMSQTDDVTGEHDDEKEARALELVIASIARMHEASPLVGEAVSVTLERRGDWPGWSAHSFDITVDCERAISVLKKSAKDADVKAYRHVLMEIAETVAAAHGEFGGMAVVEEGRFSVFLSKVTETFTGRQSENAGFMNVSPAEQDALERLQLALRSD